MPKVALGQLCGHQQDLVVNQMSTLQPKGPPAIESIIPETAGRTDTGYTLGVHLHGIRGIWHRLWGMLVTLEVMGDPQDGSLEEVRRQFEKQLGRELRPDEWEALAADAKAHGQRMAGNG